MANEIRSRYRTSVRVQSKERKRNGYTKKLRFEVCRLDGEAFEQRTQYLREIYLDPERRHTYPWTAFEKKILLLDTCQNPNVYENWRPAATEDMQARFFSNLIFNYSLLSQVHVGECVVFVRLVPVFVKLSISYQCILLVVRNRINGKVVDSIKVGLLRRGQDDIMNVLEQGFRMHTPCLSTDYQLLYQGIGFRFNSNKNTAVHDFDHDALCKRCRCNNMDSKCTLLTPEITLRSRLVAFEVTCTPTNNRKVVVAAVKQLDGTVSVYNIQALIDESIDIMQKWENVRIANLKRSQTKTNTCCTGCVVSHHELVELGFLQQRARLFKTNVPPLSFSGLGECDFSKSRCCAIKRESVCSSLEIGYTCVKDTRQILPVFLMANDTGKCTIWNLHRALKQWNPNPVEPEKVMLFPEGVVPTDISSTLSIAATLHNLNSLKFTRSPKFYTTDDSGKLRLWTLQDSDGQTSVALDQNALLSCSVNRKYPHIVAVGIDSGKIKIYNTITQCAKLLDDHSTDNPIVQIQTMQSFLPDCVYEYQKWYHPVVKLKWISDSFIMAQYCEPLFTRESTNSGAVAIWNIAKDIFDKSDALLCNKYWSLNVNNAYNTCHLAARLVCLYGGHYGCIGGVLSCDAQWSEVQGLIAVSLDATGQLHFYKPGIWSWGDCDDPMAIARLTGDEEFYRKIIARVEQEHKRLLTPPMEIDSNSMEINQCTKLRKMRAKFLSYIEDGKNQLEAHLLAQGTQYKAINSMDKLPVWCRKTFKVSGESEKYLRLVQKLVVEREQGESNFSWGSVTRINTCK